MQYLMTVNWWLVNEINGKNKPLDRHEDALAETAHSQVADAMANGMTSGELSDTVRMTDEDGDEGIAYRGHWTFEAYKPIGSVDNPVIAVVKEDKETGGFEMSISNVDRCDIVLIEDDLCGDGQSIEGVDVVGWATTCEKNEARAQLYSQEF